LLPDPRKKQAEYVEELSAIVTRLAADLVIPMDDAECEILSIESNSRRVKASVALTQGESYEVARNKYKTICLASELGIAIPKTMLVNSVDSVDSIPESIGLPAIVKPVKGSGSRGFLVLRDTAALNQVPGSILKYGNLVAQEFIPSSVAIGVSLLLNQGQARAVFAHRRIVQFPADGGPSIVRESVHHHEAEEAARLLMESLKWHGVGMVEFRVDSRTGRPVLMEINPRFWGSLPLAIASGVDFPRLLCDMFENGDVSSVETYRTGVRCVNLLPFGVSSMLSPLEFHRMIEFLQEALKSRCFDVESLNDPLPTLGAILSMMRFTIDREMTDAVFHR
jgi:predicted ATP-grasp superfamily ATP-dependent carboligase